MHILVEADQRTLGMAGKDLRRVREGRLKAEYDEWYPRISAGVWHNASWLTEIVLQQQRRGSPRWTLGRRPLCEEHFEFRGHVARQGSSPRRRSSNGSGVRI
jgi:hypothetical protein